MYLVYGDQPARQAFSAKFRTIQMRGAFIGVAAGAVICLLLGIWVSAAAPVHDQTGDTRLSEATLAAQQRTAEIEALRVRNRRLEALVKVLRDKPHDRVQASK